MQLRPTETRGTVKKCLEIFQESLAKRLEQTRVAMI